MRKLLIILTFSTLAWAADPVSETGAGFSSGMRGSGFHGQFARIQSDAFHWLLETRFFDLKGKNEVITYDYYYQPTTTGGISLIMLTAEAGARYFPFAGKIANNFAPFVTIMAGPNLVLDAPESGAFLQRWQAAQPTLALAGYIGVGLSFYPSPRTVFGIGAGYDFLLLPKVVDGTDNYSGLVLKFSYSRQK
ncbi:MAG: hypothetical protein ABIA75_04490 [Candidatus Neomarinimicrobiota bacterium]